MGLNLCLPTSPDLFRRAGKCMTLRRLRDQKMGSACTPGGRCNDVLIYAGPLQAGHIAAALSSHRLLRRYVPLCIRLGPPNCSRMNCSQELGTAEGGDPLGTGWLERSVARPSSSLLAYTCQAALHNGVQLPRLSSFSLPPPAALVLPAGEFHSLQCVPWTAWEQGEPLARRGGMWNEAAAPFVPRLADAHLRTWDPSVRFWATHMPAECTHWWAGDSGRGRPTGDSGRGRLRA